MQAYASWPDVFFVLFPPPLLAGVAHHPPSWQFSHYIYHQQKKINQPAENSRYKGVARNQVYIKLMSEI